MNHSTSIINTVVLPTGEELEVTFYGTPTKQDAGIGFYEFWGAKGFDSRPYWSCEDYGIDYDESLYTNEQNISITGWLEKNWETVDLQLTEKFND